MTTIEPIYDLSNYYLKYTKTIRSDAGYDVCLNIFKKKTEGDVVSAPKEIGAFRHLSLTLEGHGAIDDPIVKSILNFHMVDDIFTPETDSVKYGGWEEFFTPDSTMYLVIVETREDDAQWVTRWSGYVTPDSWEEDLSSYGDIRITARDNIGHLADMEFDMSGSADGLTSLSQMLREAANKIALPMRLQFNTDLSDEAFGIYGSDLNIMSAGICVKAFEGKSWYDAISSALSSFGMTMRFTDNNGVTVMPLANLPILGETRWLQPYQIKFLDGTKTLDPAYREVVSELSYRTESERELNLQAGLEFTGAVASYAYSYTSIPLPSGGTTSGSGNAPYHPIAGAEEGWSSLSAIFNPKRFDLGYFIQRNEGESARDYIYLAACQTDGKTQQYSFKSNNLGLTIKFEFAATPAALRMGEIESNDGYISQVQYAIMVEQGNVVRYWNGYTWQTYAKVLTQNLGQGETFFEVKMTSCDDITSTARVSLIFDRIIALTGNTYSQTGQYARLKKITISNEAVQMLESDKVTTINNESYNVKANRPLEIGALSQSVPFVKPQSYTNALWDTTAQGEITPFSYYCEIRNDFTSARNEFPLPLIVHRQLLMFHHVAQPILSGECVEANNGMLGFDRQYQYQAQNFILQGGTLNFHTGRMEDVTLRGYMPYDNLWEN